MKKVLSILLCLVIMFGLVPTAAFSVSAEGLHQIMADQISNISWNADTGIKYAYLNVEQDGFYDLSVEDLKKEGYLEINLRDIDEENNEAWYYTNVYLDNEDSPTANNVYLIAGHMYEFRGIYGNYDDDDEFVPLDANINVSIMKNDYQIQDLTLGQNKNLTIGTEGIDWLEFTTTSAGDYLFKSASIGEFGVDIFEKVSGEYIYYASFSNRTVTRLKLKANTQYVIKTYDWASSTKLFRFGVSKADKTISRIDIVQNNVLLLANHAWFFSEDNVSLFWSKIESFKYKITYIDKTSETLPYSSLVSKGIVIDDVKYKGGLYTYGDRKYLKPGKQQVEILCMNDQKYSSYVNVTTYLQFCSNLGANSDYHDMYIEYEDEYEQSYYWKIKPMSTTMYEFYSSDWDQIDSNFTIYDKNNNVVPHKDGGWCLVKDTEYCLNVTYTYRDGCYGDVEFWLEKERDHVHTYSNKCDTTCNVCNAKRVVVHNYKTTVVTKATITKNGKTVKKCTLCGKEADATVIKCAKTFKLSATTYTYNGKVKTPTVTVKDSAGKTLKKGTDYTVTYATGRKNVGTYKVTIKMIGKYSGTKTLSFKINPPNTSVQKVVGKSKSMVVAITKKSTQVTGYQVQYALNKRFTSAKTKTLTSYKSTKTTIKSLGAKKTYYVRVRTYKTVGGVKYYSGWSAIKYVKTK